MYTAKTFQAAKKALGLTVRPWVGQYPDLNPIENARFELERRLRAHPTAPKTKDTLFSVLQEECEAFPDAFFKSLMQIMPRRVRVVLEARGATTRL